MSTEAIERSYDKLQLLGEGAFGQVFQVKRKQDGKVSIVTENRIFHRHYFPSPINVQVFDMKTIRMLLRADLQLSKEEIEVLKTVRHQHIQELFKSTVEAGNQLCCVMTLAAKRDLRSNLIEHIIQRSVFTITRP